ncbi:MAG TPA: hypothetical protein DDZ96_11365, partial [Porphyromonadaceae bacterium]|nr:hypothetical protein [Porphyromonadaceae bacterium]
MLLLPSFYLSLDVQNDSIIKVMAAATSFEHTIRIKIGLIFFVIILFFAGILIYSYTLKRNMDEQQKEIQQYNQLLSRTNRLMISVQEAQHIINAYLGSPRRAYRQQYDSISADIYRQTIQIRDFLSQNDQQ